MAEAWAGAFVEGVAVVVAILIERAFGQRQNVFEEAVAFERMFENRGAMERVLITAAVFGARKVTRLLQIGDDPLHCPLGDADVGSDIAQTNVFVAGDAEQHVGMVAQKRP